VVDGWIYIQFFNTPPHPSGAPPQKGGEFFVADFCCAKIKLIVEIDGKIHDNQKEYDEYRTYILNNLGYKIIRFKNHEILHNFPLVVKKLLCGMNIELQPFIWYYIDTYKLLPQ